MTEGPRNQADTWRENAALLNLTHDSIFVRDMNGRILFWNRGAEETYGWSRAEALEKVVQVLLSTEFPKPLEQIEADVLENGRWEGELVHRRRDGTHIVVASRWALQRDARGAPVEILETNNDITSRKQAEEVLAGQKAALARTNVELAAANKELEAFTYSVSHDLRTPLRHIGGFSQILEEEFGPRMDPAAQQSLRYIQKGVQEMGQLIDDLLNLGRIGRQTLRERPTELNLLVEAVLADLKPETERRQIEWKIGQLPSVKCDPGLVKLVFVNLLSNAIKFTRHQERAIIEVGQIRVKGEQVFFVRDNGVGFNMRYVDKLFGIFQRLHRQDDFEGTGVGLANVRRIIHKHGGRIWAEAEPYKGAAFYFTLGISQENSLEQSMVVGGD